MTVGKRVDTSQYVSGQLSLAIPPWVGATSTSEIWDARHTARCTAALQSKLVSHLAG